MKYILKLVAEQNGVSPEEVRTEIAAAIQAGMESADVSARRQWAQIPKEHAVPTPEEVITYLAAYDLSEPRAAKTRPSQKRRRCTAEKGDLPAVPPPFFL